MNILVNGEAVPQLARPSLGQVVNKNLDMIGETPNPDDEETLRFPDKPRGYGVEQQLLFHEMTPGGPVSPIVEENPSRDNRLLRQSHDQVQNDQEGFAMPSLSSNPRHFMKMYSIDQPEQKDSDWIGRRISEL